MPHLSADGMKPLARLKKLKVLHLPYCDVTDGALKEISNCTTLEDFLFALGKSVTNEGISHLANLPTLSSLYAQSSNCTDAALAKLCELRELRVLGVQGFRITDEGCKHLLNLPSLEKLYLLYTPLSDDALKHLESIATLKELDVRETGVTEAGARRLQTKLPDLVIHFGKFPGTTLLVKAEDAQEETVKSPPFHWPARLTGIVNDAKGNPIAGAEVKLTVTEHFREGTDDAERILKTVQTTAGKSGKYTLDAADWPAPSAERPFSVTVLASAPEHAPWETWLFFRAGEREAPDVLPEVKLPRGREVTGRCVDAEGKPVVGAVIWGQSAFRQPGRWQRQHQPTDQDGRFQVMVPNGFAATLWIVSISEGYEQLEIPATHSGGLQVAMRGGTSLVGRVESLSGDPVAGTLVVLQSMERGVRNGYVKIMRFSAETDEQGRFRMPPVRGDFKCFLAQASKSSERAASESIFAKRAAPPLAPTAVSLDGKSGRKEIMLRESRTVRLSGVVRFEDGRPVEGCPIKIYGGGVKMGTPVSDKDGQYSITVPAIRQGLVISAVNTMNHRARPAEHSAGEHQGYFINLKEVTEDITNADYVFTSRGKKVEQPAEGSRSVLFSELIGLGKKEEQPSGDAPKANESEERRGSGRK